MYCTWYRRYLASPSVRKSQHDCECVDISSRERRHLHVMQLSQQLSQSAHLHSGPTPTSTTFSPIACSETTEGPKTPKFAKQNSGIEVISFNT